MCKCSDAVLVAVSIFAAACCAAAQARAPFGFGKPVSAQEIAGWDIDVRPDGKGLPRGKGSVAQGQELYDAKCASCHGTFGESNQYLALAGGVGTLASDQPVRTTGSKLNYATTLFDYIRRAMPFANPQSLAPDEVYALTAYVLNLNDILSADATLDQDSIVALKMPNRDGFTTAHGLARLDGKPDTRNVACMSHCMTEVRVSSEMPDYARDAHGNLAEQTRSVGAAAANAGAPTPPISAAQLAQKSACTACHDVSNRVVGPAFREVALKYAGDAGADRRLEAKVRAGGAGVWGSVAMPAQTQIADADVRTLVRWILDGAR